MKTNKTVYCVGSTNRGFFFNDNVFERAQHVRARDAGMQKTYIINAILKASPSKRHPLDAINTFTMTTEMPKQIGKYHKLNEYACANRTMEAMKRMDVIATLSTKDAFVPTSALKGGPESNTTEILHTINVLHMTMRRPSKNAQLNMRPILVFVEFKFISYKFVCD